MYELWFRYDYAEKRRGKGDLIMVNRAELEAKIKEKILLVGDSGTGKTYTSVKVAEAVAKAGKKVVFIDPEYGCQRELELLGDDILANIEMKVTPEWNQLKVAIEHKDDCFLKILDGLTEVFQSSRQYLEDKFVERRFYTVAGTKIDIQDTEAFVFPFTVYPRIFDNVRAVCRELVAQKPHIIVTMHRFGSTSTQMRLTEDVFRKFDTVLELRRTQGITGFNYAATAIKHRGRKFTGFAQVKECDKQLVNLFEKRLGIGEKVDVPSTS